MTEAEELHALIHGFDKAIHALVKAAVVKRDVYWSEIIESDRVDFESKLEAERARVNKLRQALQNVMLADFDKFEETAWGAIREDEASK